MKIFEKIFSIKKDYKSLHKVVTILGIKIKSPLKYYKKNGSLSKRLELLEKRVFTMEMMELLESGLWDSSFYIKNYQPKLQKYKALIHYLAEGYLTNKPLEIFDIEKYINGDKNVAPVLDFINRGRYEYAQGFFQNEYKCPQSLIDNYNKYKSTRKSEKVIYTCITNNYDSLDELAGFYYTDFDWDYVCYTDNEEYLNRKTVGIWEIRPLEYTESDNSRNNRWHKMHPHLLFPDYKESVYIDANINILTSKFFNMINNTDKDILLPIHADRVDIYKELMWANNVGFDKGNIELKQYEMFKKEGFPENYGLFENNIIYRKHHLEEIVDIMNEWWTFVRDYSQRDQCSLAYLFWKHNRPIKDYAFENTRIDYKNFCIYKHKKDWNKASVK